MMKSLKPLFLSLILSLLFALPAYSTDVIHYEGSSTIGKYIHDAAKVYRIASFEKNVDTESLGGLQCAKWGSCELGGVANQLNTEDRQQIQAFLLGYDAIAVIVNQRNPVKNLSTQDLRRIFTGRVKNWSELGGENMPINVYTVQDASATRHVFKQKVLANSGYAGTEVILPDRRIISKVAHDWGAIGHISFAFLENQKGVRAVAVDGNQASVNNPQYPITRPLYLVTHGKPLPKVQKFIDWSLARPGQEVVKKKFVGITN